MRIIQLNSWLGRLNGPMERFIAEQKPDILCLQEVLEPNPRSMVTFKDQYDFLDRIKTNSGLGNVFFGKAWGFPMGGTVINTGPAILSRYPLSNEQSMHAYREYYVFDEPSKHQSNCRLWQACSVTLPGGKSLSVANYHGYLDGEHGIGTDITVQTMQKVADATAKLKRPLIFCGDFNIGPLSPAFKTLESLNLRNLTVENAVKSTISDAHYAPKIDRDKAISDYILVSPEIEVKDFKVSEEIVSDHKALILDFEL